MTAVLDPARLRALALAATPGPWVAGVADANHLTMNLSGGHCAVASGMGSTVHHAITGGSGDTQSWIDAEFIAAANPAAILLLLGLHEDRCAEVLKLMDRLRFVEADYERRLLERDKEIVRLQAIESDASWTRNPDRSGS